MCTLPSVECQDLAFSPNPKWEEKAVFKKLLSTGKRTT